MRELGAVPAKDSVPPGEVKELTDEELYRNHNINELKRVLFVLSKDELAEVAEFIGKLNRP